MPRLRSTAELSWRWCAGYGFGPSFAAIALIGLLGHLELAVDCGSAETEFALQFGDSVALYF